MTFFSNNDDDEFLFEYARSIGEVLIGCWTPTIFVQYAFDFTATYSQVNQGRDTESIYREKLFCFIVYHFI